MSARMSNRASPASAAVAISTTPNPSVFGQPMEEQRFKSATQVDGPVDGAPLANSLI